jgi:hypothetical protein
MVATVREVPGAAFFRRPVEPLEKATPARREGAATPAIILFIFIFIRARPLVFHGARVSWRGSRTASTIFPTRDDFVVLPRRVARLNILVSISRPQTKM